MTKFDTVYLEGQKLDNENSLVSVESLMTLFSLQCCHDLNVNIALVGNSISTNNSCIRIKHTDIELYYKVTYLQGEECLDSVKCCSFPAVVIEEEPWVVVGLSASLRHFLHLKTASEPDHVCNRLLGFRKGCLQACSEVSIWTKFCEVEAVEMLKDIFFAEQINVSQQLIFPRNFIRFENHLKRPPIIHNALKKKQEYSLRDAKDKIQCAELKKKKLKELPELEHKYAEGVDLTLADLLLYVSFSLCIHRFQYVLDFNKICPLVFKWYSDLSNDVCLSKGKSLLKSITDKYSPIRPVFKIQIQYPELQDESLYKSDPDRYKPRWRAFTHQKDIDKGTSLLQDKIHFKEIQTFNDGIIDIMLNKSMNVSSSLETLLFNLNMKENENKMGILYATIQNKCSFQWNSFPSAVSPADGDLPSSRLERKCQQLESLAKVVVSLAKEGNKIIDFCSGGGHLGILIAYLLPQCRILLVENRHQSLMKAYERVKTLGLRNVLFYQCNLDYFHDTFDIGVCLHACGVATDLVMLKCHQQKAAFVCSPCCYGSLKPNHILTYPRSSFFVKNCGISLHDYLVLAHAADQTHAENNPKTEQGKRCMKYVDSDRLFGAQSLGYKTILAIMNPPDCTTKNHILIGVLPSL